MSKIAFSVQIALFILVSANTLRAQKEAAINQIETFAVSWDAKYNLARNPKNIKQYHEFYFRNGNTEDFNKMFLDYNDCVEKLTKQKTLTDSSSNRFVNVLVEISFGKKIVSVCFDRQGNFFYGNTWHVKSNEMYYLLFKYFSGEIVPPKVLEETKSNYKDDFWHPSN